MKKQNNRYRNGNNANNGYTLNYKFDSVSIAGKISGTALDLIRRYNDLAKEAQSSNNYVEMEVYRQYAEHYRKIVTEINEKRQPRPDNQNQNKNEETAAEATSTQENNEEKPEPIEVTPAANGYVETLPATEPVKTFTVVEIKEPAAEDKQEETVKPKKTVRKKPASPRKKAEVKEAPATAAEA